MENPMSCPKNRLPKSRLIAAALAMTAACVSTSALAQSMIVRSTGPSAPKYPVGKKLAVNEKITLVAGDRVVLLDKGKTRTLAKPGTHNSSASVAANQTLSTTMTARGHCAVATAEGSPAGTTVHRWSPPKSVRPICGCSTRARAAISASPIQHG
jgi:hypothetical protein